MTRWTHAHTAVGAFAGALIVERNGWLIVAGLAAMFVAGWVARGARVQIGRGVHAVSGLVSARVETERERRRAVRAGTRLKVEKARELRSDREKRERKAYMMGAIDGGKS